MGQLLQQRYSRAFALPVVMISSVVMMMVLLSGLTAATSVNVAIRDQYYTGLAQQAAQSGVAVANACLKNSNYAASPWTNTLEPNTDCSGTEVVDCTTSQLIPRCGVIESQGIRTTFAVSTITLSAGHRYYTVTGTAKVLRNSTRAIRKAYTTNYKIRELSTCVTGCTDYRTIRY